jgi:hypothetical protein
VAGFHGHRHLVEPLLALGADINETDEQGRTALDRAFEHRDQSEHPEHVRGCAELIQLLFSQSGGCLCLAGRLNSIVEFLVCPELSLPGPADTSAEAGN